MRNKNAWFCITLAAMNFLNLTLVFIFSLFSFGLSSFTPIEAAPNEGHLNYGVPVSQLVSHPIQKQNFSVLVQKSSYTVFLKYNGRVIKSYPCVFGSNPISDKLKQGDMCTPEGNFKISDVREHFIWGYFIAFDYPNQESWEKHNYAKSTGQLSSSADIGGSLGFHGVIEGLESYIDTKNNWTEGCVSVKNTDVNELAEYLQVGTPVKIVY